MADDIYAGDAGLYKTCSRCGQTKPIWLFSKEKRSLSGYAAACKLCVCEHVKKYASENPEKIKARRQNMTPAAIAADNAKKNQKYLDDPLFAERARARARLWYEANREKVLARMSSDTGREYSRNRMRENLKDDSFRVYSNVSRGIRASIKDKSGRGWEDVVGYTLEQLIRHLERQFLKGMSWENHGVGRGKWHIDHIIPRVCFQFSSADDEDFKACWALTNLRPLWSEENISKHGKRLHLL